MIPGVATNRFIDGAGLARDFIGVVGEDAVGRDVAAGSDARVHAELREDV